MNLTLQAVNQPDVAPRRWAPAVIVTAVFLLAIAAAGGSAWFRLVSSRKPIEFLGRDEAKRLLIAPQATLYQLRESSAGSSGTAAVGQPELGEWPLATAPGFSHLRRCLLSNRSYDWAAPVDAGQAVWTWRLVVQDESGQVALEFDLDRGWMRVVNHNRAVSIAPAVSAFETFFAAVTQPSA